MVKYPTATATETATLQRYHNGVGRLATMLTALLTTSIGAVTTLERLLANCFVNTVLNESTAV